MPKGPEGFHSKDPYEEEAEREKQRLEDVKKSLSEYSADQIANNPEEINPFTMAYTGKLTKEAFQKFLITQGEIYVSSLNRKIQIERLGSDNRGLEDLLKEAEMLGIELGSELDDLLSAFDMGRKQLLAKAEILYRKINPTVEQSKKDKSFFVRLSLTDLGFDRGATINEIYQAYQELGLLGCSPKAGISYCLENINSIQEGQKIYFNENYTFDGPNIKLDLEYLTNCIFYITREDGQLTIKHDFTTKYHLFDDDDFLATIPGERLISFFFDDEFLLEIPS